MPHFQDQLGPPQESYDWIVGTDHTFVKRTLAAIDKSRQAYASERGEDAPPLLGGEPAERR